MLGCTQDSPSPQVGMRDRAGKQHLYLLFKKKKKIYKNIKIEKRLNCAESAHFPSGRQTQSKTFYTNQFLHSSMQGVIRLLRSNFLSRPPRPRGAWGHSLSVCLSTGVGSWRCGGGVCHAISLCARSRLRASCARECVHRSPAMMMPTVPKGLLGLSR